MHVATPPSLVYFVPWRRFQHLLPRPSPEASLHNIDTFASIQSRYQNCVLTLAWDLEFVRERERAGAETISDSDEQTSAGVRQSHQTRIHTGHGYTLYTPHCIQITITDGVRTRTEDCEHSKQPPCGPVVSYPLFSSSKPQRRRGRQDGIL